MHKRRSSNGRKVLGEHTLTRHSLYLATGQHADISLSMTPQTAALNDDITYTLTVTDINGCSANGSVMVKIFMPFYMPRAFTPNNDGKNELYRIPPHTTITLDEFSIYGRWGNKLFTTKEANSGWNGQINGVQAPSGVYIYLVQGITERGKQMYKGSFVLIR
jgi:gliding motility-associated-like protein